MTPQVRQGDLLASAACPREALAEGALLLRAFASAELPALVEELRAVWTAAPFRHMETPGGFRMSVAMTNCGAVGWITDRRGYRYQACDPLTGRACPPIPAPAQTLAVQAAAAAGYPDFRPDACLVNRYEPGARMSLHQDRNERDLAAPVVSLSIGLPAIFLWGGASRRERPRHLLLESGDVLVWGGASRLHFHGVAALAEGVDALTGACRLNLTLRQAL
jgi:alkylated DNA repair protein (DNA oxidative demethylase)